MENRPVQWAVGRGRREAGYDPVVLTVAFELNGHKIALMKGLGVLEAREMAVALLDAAFDEGVASGPRRETVQ